MKTGSLSAPLADGLAGDDCHLVFRVRLADVVTAREEPRAVRPPALCDWHGREEHPLAVC